eukprot:Hpha_TRINITY_DN14476_c0_g2::TRINITY_DN14476_c0_g2_i1::g.157827::m.157827
MKLSYDALNDVLGLLTSEISNQGQRQKDVPCGRLEPPDEESAARIRRRLVELQDQRVHIEQEQAKLERELQRIEDKKSVFLNDTFSQIRSLLQTTLPHCRSSGQQSGIAERNRTRPDRGNLGSRGSGSTDQATRAHSETHDPPARRVPYASSSTSPGSLTGGPVPLPRGDQLHVDRSLDRTEPRPLPKANQPSRWGTSPPSSVVHHATRTWAPPSGSTTVTRTEVSRVMGGSAARDGALRRSKSVEMMPQRGAVSLGTEAILSLSVNSHPDNLRSRTAEHASPKNVNVPSGVGNRAARSQSVMELPGGWARDSESAKPFPGIPRLPLHILTGGLKEARQRNHEPVKVPAKREPVHKPERYQTRWGETPSDE